MSKKNLLAVGMAIVLAAGLLAGCTEEKNSLPTAGTANEPSPSDPAESSVREDVLERITLYTKSVFRFKENVALEDKGGGYALKVSFVPEVGSVPIKEDMYRIAAQHAFAVSQFFPEIATYSYSVLWNESDKKEVMKLELNEDAVLRLAGRYADAVMNEKNGAAGSWKELFSSVDVKGSAVNWNDR